MQLPVLFFLLWQERAVNCIIYISLLALQGIANGSDELGNLLLLDRNEQRDELLLDI